MNMRIRNNTNAILPKFKGVVPQSNGHWGAQIYANHQRIWLGTFKSENDAAMAYDSASLKLRTGDNQRNFPWSNITVHEPKFQSFYNADAILNMIRDGSYPSKFSDFVQSQVGGQELGLSSTQDYSGFSCKLLFQKELTPSDVSKLNRLVVPKKYAVKYFPRINNGKDDNADGEKTDEVHLVFYDKMMRQWKFRYCYWQSSQSFVFTRGWNRFVKEKKLNANDMIAFYVCESRERANEGQSFWLIDIGCSGEMRDVRDMSENVDVKMDLCLRLGQQVAEEEEEEEEEEDELVGDQVSTKFEMDRKKATRIRLFGVEIN